MMMKRKWTQVNTDDDQIIKSNRLYKIEAVGTTNSLQHQYQRLIEGLEVMHLENWKLRTRKCLHGEEMFEENKVLLANDIIWCIS